METWQIFVHCSVSSDSFRLRCIHSYTHLEIVSLVTFYVFWKLVKLYDI